MWKWHRLPEPETLEERTERWKKQYPHLSKYLHGDPASVYLIPTLENICKRLDEIEKWFELNMEKKHD